MKHKNNTVSAMARLLVDSGQLLVTLDAKGVIRGLMPRNAINPGWTSLDYYRRLLCGSHFSRFFHVPRGRSLQRLSLVIKNETDLFTPESLFNSECFYHSKNLFENYEAFSEYYTTLPVSRIYIRYYKPMGYFGIIRFEQSSALTYYYRSNPVVLLDRHGTIQGVNGSFVYYYKSEGLTAAGMLGKAIEEFLLPNPMESLSGRTGDFDVLRREKWEKETPLDCAEKSGELLPLLPPLDTTQYDFRLACRFRLEAGALPGVIVNGSRDYKQYFPDFNGYLLAPAPSGRAFQVKKEGRIVHQSPFKAEVPPGNHTVEIIKRGACLAYFLDGDLVIGYRDPVLFTGVESHQYVFRRPGTRMSLDTARLGTLPAARNLHQGFNEVSQVRGGQNVFQYHALADDALRRGSELYYGFILYDVTFLKKNIALLQKAQAGLARERDKYKNLALGKEPSGEPFVGESPLLLKLKSEAHRAAQAPVTVLIEGDTGTGKEVLARYIHAQSARKDGPFVKVDCSTLPESLIESELFGVEKGAFTGAAETRPGKLESAAGGTLFLDELGNLDLKTQAKLLNFLQDFTLSRLGSTHRIKVDARIVAATNRPLKGMIEQGLFRADLYFRISTVKFRVPPLKERLDDINPLCGHFLRVYSEKFHRQIKGFTPQALQKLMAHAWPGNVRELENTVQKAVLFCETDVIGEDRIEMSGEWAENRADTSQISIPRGNPRALTREHVEELLKRNNGIVEWAARDARVSRNTLFRKIRKFGITAKPAV